MKVSTEAGSFTGKTYNLRGSKENSEDYYKLISGLTDTLIEEFGDPVNLLNLIREAGGNKKRLKKLLRSSADHSPEISLLKILESLLENFINVEEHLKSLSIFDSHSKVIRATREQYYLFMLEIEIVNRINRVKFFNTEKRIALLPHCLRDLNKKCQSYIMELDYVCKGCSKICYINKVSKLLREAGVIPYIWQTIDQSKIFEKNIKKESTLGVLGIACVPELVSGMRLCMKHGVPAVGIPLDANRCRRWMGEFYSNTVNINALQRLLKN